jgi:hypothetical protein
MFNRWRQENYFRYARQHFALDALDTYTVHRRRPGPQRAQPGQTCRPTSVRQLEKVVADAEATLGRHRNTPQLSGSLDELDTTLDEVRGQLADARQTAADTPTRLPLADVAPDARLLDTETKLLTHACRIAAYNTESALARLIAPHYARANDEARSLIREALTTAGDLHIADGHIHVTLNPLSAPRRTSTPTSTTYSAPCDPRRTPAQRHRGADGFATSPTGRRSIRTRCSSSSSCRSRPCSSVEGDALVFRRGARNEASASPVGTDGST